MRTVTEIKAEMTTAFMADADVKAKYDPTSTWTGTTIFSDVFAASSIESILFYIMAICAYGIEFLFGKHLIEVAALETKMRVGTKEWWRQLCLKFQLGDSLVFNSATNTYEYTTVDETHKIIKYVDIRETTSGLVMLINEADGDGKPVQMSTTDLTNRNAFEAYIRKVKVAGIPLIWNSYNADKVTILLKVIYDPLIVNASGELISTGVKTVDLAIENYLKNIPYGSGTMNKTQIIDAIQSAEGVIDVYPEGSNWLQVSTDYTPAYTAVLTQNINAYGGSFALDVLTITYASNV